MIASEVEMGDCFERYLQNIYLTDGLEKTLVREFDGNQGIPDFVIPVGQWKNNELELLLSIANLKVSGLPQIIYCLERDANLTKISISTKTGLSSHTIERTCRELEVLGIVSCETGHYSLSKVWKAPEIDFWAFELKLSNWKRAVYQSLRYLTFASGSITVFPKEMETLVRKNISNFENFDLGIIFFDSENSKAEWLIVPERQHPRSRVYYLSALFSYLRKVQLTQLEFLTVFPISTYQSAEREFTKMHSSHT